MILSGWQVGTAQRGALPNLVDGKADKRTRLAYRYLQQAEKEGKVLFGHQDALAYGVGWREIPGGSDVKAVCGDYPAVYGWELGDLEHADAVQNLDTVNFQKMKAWIIEGHKRGGINTISWHMDNFRTGGSSWDTTGAVTDILPGGPKHEAYIAGLDRFADFINDLKAGGFLKRKKIPILFRPFHEHTGHWFWWCNTHVTPENYKAIWKFTVSYLRDVKQLHNLIYVFNTAENVNTEEEFLQFYPGDEWVDILSLDSYRDVRDEAASEGLKTRLAMLADLAARKGKVSALAETGLEGIPHPEWWTRVFLNGILPRQGQPSVAYAMVWRNANKKHHYGPYPDHVSAANFIEFHQHPVTVFEKELPGLQKRARRGEGVGRR